MEKPRLSQRVGRLEFACPAEDLRVINEFAVSLLRQQTVDDLLWAVAEKIGTVLRFEDCVVYLLEGDRLVQRAAFGIKNPERREIADRIDIELGAGIVGAVAATGVSRLVPDTLSEPCYIADKFQGRSELAVPIRFEDRVIGVIDSESSELNGYAESDLEMVEWIANIAASRIASALADRELVIAQESLRLANESLEERVRSCTDDLTVALRQEHRAHLLESVGRLAGGVAHDFNNLLTAIHGNIALAQLDAPDVGELRPVLDAALRSCRDAQALPARLLVLADGGAPKLRTSNGLLDLVRDTALAALRDTGIDCRLDLPACLPTVDFDSVQISQVIHSLLRNARQALPEGGTVVISGRATRQDGGATVPEVGIEIRDDGPGVPPQYHDRVFDPYFSTITGNTGLGLTIAQSVMARHGGRLELDTTAASGAVFRLCLPCSSRLEQRTHRRCVSAGPASVLVLEDEPGIRALLERMMPHLGHSVTVTARGDETLREYHRRAAGSKPFDVVMFDLTVVGGMGGLKTLEALRRSDPRIPAIVMSGYSSEGAVAEPQRYGFQASLAKPFDAEALRAVLDEVLGGQVLDADAGSGS